MKLPYSGFDCFFLLSFRENDLVHEEEDQHGHAAVEHRGAEFYTQSGTNFPATATQMQLMEFTMQVITMKASRYRYLFFPQYYSYWHLDSKD